MYSRCPDDTFSIDCNPSTEIELIVKKKHECNERRQAKNTPHVKIFYICNWKRCQLPIEHCICVQVYIYIHLKRKISI